MNTRQFGNMRVSVVIPCYNQGQYLGYALESLNASTYPHIEVIVVDDGSTDPESRHHLDKLRDYQVKGIPIRILCQTNAGPSAARNAAVRASSGEFILPLDADDKIDPTFIEKAIWVLTKHTDKSIAYPSVRHFGAKDDYWEARPFDPFAMLHDNYMIVSSVYRRKVWETIHGYDESIRGYEDWDFWIRAIGAGFEGYWLPEGLFYYRKHENSKLVRDNASRKRHVRELRQKNKSIYRRLTKHLTSEKKNAKKPFINPMVKWRLFVLYVRLASKVSPSIKSKVGGFVKPLIKRLFGYHEISINQSQTLERGDLDEHIEERYQYIPNQAYIEVLPPTERQKTSILFIAPWLQVGGADKVNLDLMLGLQQAGFATHLFTTLNDKHPWHEKFASVTPNITHLGNWFSDPDELLDYVIDYIAARGIQLIQVSNSQLGYQLSPKIKQYCPHVKIVDLNHMEEPYYPFDYFRYSVRYKGSMDRRIVITDYLKQAMVRKYGESIERVTVIPNGVAVLKDYSQTNYASKNGVPPFTIGFVGRMEEQKQPLQFVTVARIILDRAPNVKFVMVGGGSLLAQTKNYARSVGIYRNMEFTGPVNDAASIMRERFHLLVAPSIREGLPIVGLEAMALGIPIVASDVPGWSELLDGGTAGFLTEAGNAESMAECCLLLMDDAELRQRLSKQAFLKVQEKYSLERMAASYMELFCSLLSQGVSRSVQTIHWDITRS